MKSSPIARMVPFLLLLLACGGAFAAEARRPNILFIIADAMFRDMLNCTPEGRGRNVTPTLDRLAAEGVVMQGQHIVSLSVTRRTPKPSWTCASPKAARARSGPIRHRLPT